MMEQDSLSNPLLEEIEQHEAAEAESIRTYRELSVSAGDPIVSLIMRLILEDEERHHAVLKRIATMLRESPALSHMAEAPKLGSDHVRRARERITAAADDEREGARKLALLAQGAAGHVDGITGLLLDMLAKDSEKHERMLRYALDRLSPGAT